MLICLVILHYLDDKTTIECVDSILNSINLENYRVIIVDNGSNNSSYERMKEYYKNEQKVEVIKNQENLGFSRGNNVGYYYVKKKYQPEFILVGNNDLEFSQYDFVEKLVKMKEVYNFDVAGPDIVDMEGIHQNPFRNQICSYKKIKKLTRNRRIILWVLKLKERLPFLEKYEWLEKWYFSKGKKERNSRNIENACEDIVLHGACLIFASRYIKEQDTAFPEYTFMYMEEDILALRCKQEKYRMYYLPELKVLHKEMVSTKSKQSSNLKKNIFFFSECIKAGKIYENLVKKYR